MLSFDNSVVCTNLIFLLPKNEEEKIWKISIFFLSKITFEPDTPGTWKRGKRAKWFAPWKFWPGVAPCSGHFQKFGRNWQRQKGAFWVVPIKKTFFGKNLFKFYHEPICALAIEWATKQCSALGAITPLLCIDNWKKLAKNTKNGPPEVIGIVISGVDVRAIQIKVHLSDVPNSVLQ